jgi:hypothetical protein
MENIISENNRDIEQLLKKGYALSIDSNCLVIRDIPYINNVGELQIGAIISKLNFVDNNKARANDHQILFCGSHPYQLDGTSIKNLGGGPTTFDLKSTDLKIQRSFSNKPPNGFKDLNELVESYVSIISGPATIKFNSTPLTFRTVDEKSDSVFNFRDTLTSRAEIGGLHSNLKNDSIAIIGLGGTGSYILDFIAKTPVKEIRGFDLKDFHIHNAFRSPGKLDPKELGKSKADVYQNRYENFRNGINLHSEYIDSESGEHLKGITFAFVSVDKGAARAEIFSLLMKLKIPFIDVGMGLDKDNGPISGMARVTYFSEENYDELLNQKLATLSDIPDDIYKSNIQISELNALNASIAVIKYKQIRKFYADEDSYHHVLFTVDALNCLGQNGKV